MIKAILENALVNQAIAEVLNEHENDWLNNQPMVESKTQLDLLNEQSVKLRMVTGVKSTTETMFKNGIKAEMLKDANLLHSALTVYADQKKMDKLKIQVEIEGKRLSKAKKNLDIYDACCYIHSLASTHLPALLNYQITQIMLDKTDATIKNFIASVPLTKIIIKSNKESNKLLINNDKEIKKLLKFQMDKLTNVIAEDCPELAGKYFALRTNNKTRGKNKKNPPN
jgi:hypothetical protein